MQAGMHVTLNARLAICLLLECKRVLVPTLTDPGLAVGSKMNSCHKVYLENPEGGPI